VVPAPAWARLAGRLGAVRAASARPQAMLAHRQGLATVASNSGHLDRKSTALRLALLASSSHSVTGIAPWTRCLATVQHSAISAHPEDGTSDRRGGSADDRQLDRVTNMMTYSLQRNGRVNANDVWATLRLLDATGRTLTSNLALLLLRCSGRAMVDERPLKRTQLSMDIWKRFEDAKVGLDVSHYNALLRAHLDNGHSFSPTEFLAWMESKGVTANRITYQHLIARFCDLGDMSGATAVLEQMKKESMPVNEYVFQSLIRGHAIAGDADSARDTLRIMSESGLHAGKDAYVALACGMAIAGQDFDQVMNVLAEAEKADVVLDDRGIFDLMVTLIQSGKADDAQKLMDKLPQRTGYFQEMRNVVPQLVFEGQTDLAFSIFANSQSQPWTRASARERDARDHGLFFLRAMVKMDYPPEKIVSVLSTILEKDINKECVARVLEACVEYDRAEIGAQIYELAKQELGRDCVKPTDVERYLRQSLSRCQGPEEICDVLNRFATVGLRVRPNVISDCVMPAVFKDKSLNLMAAIDVVKDCKLFSFSGIVNNTIQTLLNEETREAFAEVVSATLNVDIPLRAVVWNSSLARSFLATNDLDLLITMLFVGGVYRRKQLGKEDEAAENQTYLFRTISHVAMNHHRYHSGSESSTSSDNASDDTVRKILEELKKLHIGLPAEAANLVRTCVVADDLKKLVDDLEEVQAKMDEHWTEEKINAFVEERKALLRGMTKRGSQSGRGTNFVPIRGQSYVDEKDMPDSLTEMLRLHDVLQKRGGLSTLLVKRILEAYLQDGKRDECVSFLEAAMEDNKFSPRMDTLETIINSYLNDGKLNEAREFLLRMQDKNLEIWSSSAFSVAKKIDEEKGYDELKTFLRQLKSELIRGDKMSDLASDYSLRGDSEKV
jgi:pentatricopeptide repeat protein